MTRRVKLLPRLGAGLNSGSQLLVILTRNVEMFVDDELQEDKAPTPKERVARGEHPLTVWREHRGFSVGQVAQRADVPAAVILVIEAVGVKLVPDARATFAKALGIRRSDLLC